MPQRRRPQALAHDTAQRDQLGLDGVQDAVVGEEEPVDDGALEPFEVRGVRPPGGEDRGQVVRVESLEEGGAAGGDLRG